MGSHEDVLSSPGPASRIRQGPEPAFCTSAGSRPRGTRRGIRRAAGAPIHTPAHSFYLKAGFRQETPAERFRRPPAPALDPESQFLALAARAANRVASALARWIGVQTVDKAADLAAEAAALEALAPLQVPVLAEEGGWSAAACGSASMPSTAARTSALGFRPGGFPLPLSRRVRASQVWCAILLRAAAGGPVVAGVPGSTADRPCPSGWAGRGRQPGRCAARTASLGRTGPHPWQLFALTVLRGQRISRRLPWTGRRKRAPAGRGGSGCHSPRGRSLPGRF